MNISFEEWGEVFPPCSTTNHARRSMYNVQRVNVSQFCSFYTLHKKRSFPLRISSVKLWIWSHLLKKSLMKNLIFCPVTVIIYSQKMIFPFLIRTLQNSVFFACLSKYMLFDRYKFTDWKAEEKVSWFRRFFSDFASCVYRT